MVLYVLTFCFFVLFSLGLVLTNNILLSLVGVGSLFLLYAVFLFSIHFYYLAFTIGIVYLGAIIILFIYVIMLINLLTSNYNTLAITINLQKRVKLISFMFLLLVSSLLLGTISLFFLYYPLNFQFYQYFWKLSFPVYFNWYQSYYLFLYDYLNFNILYMRLDYAFLTLIAAVALFLGLVASIILVHIDVAPKTYFLNTQMKLLKRRTANNMFIQNYRDVLYTIYLANR